MRTRLIQRVRIKPSKLRFFELGTGFLVFPLGDCREWMPRHPTPRRLRGTRAQLPASRTKRPVHGAIGGSAHPLPPSVAASSAPPVPAMTVHQEVAGAPPPAAHRRAGALLWPVEPGDRSWTGAHGGDQGRDREDQGSTDGGTRPRRQCTPPVNPQRRLVERPPGRRAAHGGARHGRRTPAAAPRGMVAVGAKGRGGAHAGDSRAGGHGAAAAH